MRAAVVIGAGFGDEGKGLMTDYLCSQGRSLATVVRFNGGAQAGHTVQTPSGQRHVFHHFGSGTLAGSFTCLGPEFLVNPILFCKERDELSDQFGRLTAIDAIGCHPMAPVTTPYDMVLNQLAEVARGRARHGSCGVGIGETVARGEAGFPILAKDIGSVYDLNQRLREIELRWFFQRAKALGADKGDARDVFAKVFANRHVFIEACAKTRQHMLLTPERPPTSRIVFEGAQGLLLDQRHPFFPYVTRSNTGLTNVLPLAQAWALDGLDVTYVTRCYLTRHGAGPLPNETSGPPYTGIRDKTNVPHPFQGTLRYALLNLGLLAEAIKWDLESTGLWFQKLDANIALTCADHVGGSRVMWTHGDRTHGGSIADLADAIRAVTGLRVQYISRGPSRTNIEAQYP